jgi:hypothetical protein
MASTYVNDLRLNEMATGDGSGTWGTTTNTNLALISEAFSYGTEVITTNADTHTTTIADGATDPGRSLYLKYTGTLDSACTITIGPNTVSKVWIIENGTSGSQDIILSQGSGANITIPAGDTKVVYSDGAGAGAAFVDAFASLSVVDLKVQDDLTVTGDIDVDGTTNLDVVDIDGALTQDGGAVFNETGADVDFRVESDTVDHALFVQGSDGNVGIGTSSPSADLQINDGNTTRGVAGTFHMYGSAVNGDAGDVSNEIFFRDESVSGWGGAFIRTVRSADDQNGKDALTFGTSPSGGPVVERMRIDSVGNVGIGLANPSDYYAENLVVVAAAEGGITIKSAATDHGYLMFADGTSGNEAYRAYISHAHDGDTTNLVSFGSIGLSSVNETTFSTNSIERMRINSSGNVGIGETSITARLHIKANGDTTTPCVINNTAAGADTRNQIQFQRNGTIVGSITSTASATVYNTSSDYRLKENVVTDWDATTRLKQLKPSRFNFIVDADKTVDGFLAHEVQDIVPEAITGEKDGEEMQGIDQSKLVPLLTKALQEALTKIEQLETRLETLENA